MQSKQLYKGRKLLQDRGSKKVQRERSREIERKSEHCKSEKCKTLELLLLSKPKEELK